MTDFPLKAQPVPAFAAGGFAHRPTVSMFGEARGSDVCEHLQADRTIPVTGRGNGGSPIMQEINVYQTFKCAVPTQLPALMDNVKQAVFEAMREHQRRGRG